MAIHKNVPVGLIDMDGPEHDPTQREQLIWQVAQSMREHGFVLGPGDTNRIQLVMSGDRYVLRSGRIRYLAAIEVGLTEVPCIVYSEREAKQLRSPS